MLSERRAWEKVSVCGFQIQEISGLVKDAVASSPPALGCSFTGAYEEVHSSDCSDIGGNEATRAFESVLFEASADGSSGFDACMQ